MRGGRGERGGPRSRPRGCRAGTTAPTARRCAGRCRRWAARGWTRRGSRRARPGRRGPTKMAPALRTRAARAAASSAWISRCSGAQASTTARAASRSSTSTHADWPARAWLDPLPVPGGRQLRGQRRRRPGRRGSGSVVISRQAASGSCSAWAIRSAATKRGVGGVVGEDRDLGRAGLGVGADGAPEQPFGRGDVDVARAGDEVGRCAVGGAVGEHRDRLRAAGRVHLVDAEQRAGGEHGRVRQAAVLGLRRRGHRDLADPGHLGRDDVHDHGGRVGDQPAGHVDARPGRPGPSAR